MKAMTVEEYDSYFVSSPCDLNFNIRSVRQGLENREEGIKEIDVVIEKYKTSGLIAHILLVERLGERKRILEREGE